MRFIQILLPACVCGFGAAASEALAAIYVCTDADGQLTFTDQGCPGKMPYTPTAAAPLKFAPIGAAQDKQLETLARRTAAAQRARQKALREQRKHAAKAAGERRRACDKATTALEMLGVKRRKGYKLSAQQNLDAKEAALRKAKRQTCR